MPIDRDIIVRTLIRDRARLYAYTLAVSGDEHVAEDILQEIALAAIENAAEIDDSDHLARWLRRAAKLRALNHRRKTKSQPNTLSDEVLEALEDEWQNLDRHPVSDSLDALKQCMKSLTPVLRRIIDLRYGDGLTSGQIALRLGRNVNTIYTSVNRAHVALARCVRKHLNQPESPR